MSLGSWRGPGQTPAGRPSRWPGAAGLRLTAGNLVDDWGAGVGTGGMWVPGGGDPSPTGPCFQGGAAQPARPGPLLHEAGGAGLSSRRARSQAQPLPPWPSVRPWVWTSTQALRSRSLRGNRNSAPFLPSRELGRQAASVLRSWRPRVGSTDSRNRNRLCSRASGCGVCALGTPCVPADRPPPGRAGAAPWKVLSIESGTLAARPDRQSVLCSLPDFSGRSGRSPLWRTGGLWR